MRRVGVLMNATAERSGSADAMLAAFQQGLQELGWTRRPQCSHRHALGRRRRRAHAQIRGGTGGAFAGRDPGRRWPDRSRVAAGDAAPCRSCSRSRIDPVGAGFVASLARPGGNVTGFTQFEYGLSGKWLELLKEIAPERDARRRPARSSQPGRDRAVGRSSRPLPPSTGMEVSPLAVRERRRDRARHRRLSRAIRMAV